MYYVGTQLAKEGKEWLLGEICEHAGVKGISEDNTELEIVCRYNQDKTIYFIMNFKETEQIVPKRFWGCTDLLTQKSIPENAKLTQYGVYIISERT